MDLHIVDLIESLNNFDENPSARLSNSIIISDYPGLISYLIQNLSGINIKILRQLLEYIPEQILEEILINETLPSKLIEHIKTQPPDYDSIKILSDIYDESIYEQLVDSEVLSKLVYSIQGAGPKMCENLVKVLVFISKHKMQEILSIPNSRNFGEILIYRLNRAQGIEKKLMLKTVTDIIFSFPDYFYINDLKVVCDIVVDSLSNQEEEILTENYEALTALMDVKDFFDLKYRFSEIYEVLQVPEGNSYILKIQDRIYSMISN
ncbi:hypothetical protein SteCoe_13981 [Stentor coeruleus]|uniref:SPIN90/Ldb17 leucine-rich domain-containing protein n=1 Tax=Stentor coeruleus TaxID=5963 RepID=A0A1R2C7E4_9CILI|nr:hypothetical protein SteCoe_13981 [Stentor coeruleus]